ncbi:electron transfer flavoprotein subunit alpha [candidate division KSB1 bacterium]|nr:electron transfer flavoprotein subunit alpha [candidate division KSB1 bacterium]
MDEKTTNGLVIHGDRCLGCGLCIPVCPFGALEMVDGVVRVEETVCTLCGACVEHCPVEALELIRHTRKVADAAAWSGVWVFAETQGESFHSVVYELLGVGKGLARARNAILTAVVVGDRDESSMAPLFIQGAERVILAAHSDLAAYNDEPFARILERLVREYRPEIVLAGATAIGRALIPRAATLLGTGLTADCTGLEIDPESGNLLQTRPAFGGNIMARIVCASHRPQMATVRPRVMKALVADPLRRSGQIIHYTPSSDDLVCRTRVESIISDATGDPDLTSSEIIVAGGRGVGGAESFRLLKELAEVLGGTVAASRAAVDAGWIAADRQVGQTGKTVAPKLYVAVGISGAVQHVVGMSSAETIIAIDKNPSAPIFEMADVGLVGNLFEILPPLIRRFRELKSTGHTGSAKEIFGEKSMDFQKN